MFPLSHSKARSARKSPGFTAIEGLLVLGLIAVVSGLSAPLYRQFQIRSDLDKVTGEIVQQLDRAQTLAQAGQDDTAWGVYVQEATLYAGDAYVLRDPSKDEVFEVPSTIDASGLDEVTFTLLDGAPTMTGTIILTALNGEYREILISNTGVIGVSDIQSPPTFPSVGGETSGDNGATSTSGESAGSGSDETSGSEGGDTSSTSGDTSGGTTSGDTGDSTSGDDGGTTAGDTGDTGDTGGSDTGSDGGDGGSDDEPGECSTAFSLQNNRVETVGTNDVTVKVLGSEITYGSGGPEVSVRVSTSFNNGDSWHDFNNGNDVDGNEQEVFTNIPENTPLSLRFNGRYSWLFNKTYDSDNSGGHIEILRNGDLPPDYAPFGNQSSLSSYLQNILDDEGRISIGPKDLVYLVELSSLDSNADFQDAVVLVTFNPKPYTCVSQNEVRVKFSFNRVENTGNGDADNVVYAGPQTIAFGEEQWIPLTNDGQMITDASLVQDVPGLALQRGEGWIRVISHGSHNGGSKEIVDARILFNKGYITSIVNEDGTDKSENPTDGIVNDGPGGDEFVDGPNAKSMEFKTRVTNSDDGVILYWSAGNPSDSQNSSSDGGDTSGSESSEASSEDTSGDTTGDTSGDDNEDVANDYDPSADECYVPYTVDEDGLLTLHGNADLSVSVGGAYSTYGYRGPEVQVRTQIKINDDAYQPLFNYRSLDGGEFTTFSDVASGSQIRMEFSGRYSWVFRKTIASGEGRSDMRVLTRGEAMPDYPLINGQTTLKSFMREVMNANRTANVGGREVLYLAELGTLNASADFQDAVVILAIDKPASEGSCVSGENGSSVGGGSSSDDTGDDTSGGTGGTTGGDSGSDDEGSTGGDTGGTSDDSDGDTIPNSIDVCPGTYMPESVPTVYMLFRRHALTTTSPIFREGPQERTGEFSLSDTRGCSCEQILDAIDGDRNNRFREYPRLYRSMRNLFSYYVSSSRKFGCSESLLDMVRDGF